jgi:hypothetical protein
MMIMRPPQHGQGGRSSVGSIGSAVQRPAAPRATRGRVRH